MRELSVSPPVHLSQPARRLVAAPLLPLVAYLVTFDRGTVSQAGDRLHELMHDGRHLLGVPCH